MKAKPPIARRSTARRTALRRVSRQAARRLEKEAADRERRLFLTAKFDRTWSALTRLRVKAESFFATLECELLDRHRFKTQAEAQSAVCSWIESWYNAFRRHSSLGYLSPVEFEKTDAEGGTQSLGVTGDLGSWGNLASRNSRGAGRKSGGSAPGTMEGTQTGEETPQATSAFEKSSKARNRLRNPGRSNLTLLAEQYH